MLGAKFLLSKFQQLGSWTKAIAHYHSATPHLGEKYKDNVVKIAQNIDHYKSAFKRNPGSNIVKLKPKPVLKPKSEIYVRSNDQKIPFNNKDKKYRSNMMLYVKKGV